MLRIIIFGNSGSGKSTLARELADREALAHLDLDTLAWRPTSPPSRKPLAESGPAIDEFIAGNEGWVIEGCYADLIAWVLPRANRLYFLDLPVSDCIDNAKRRPWEPHKYVSQEAQDANLPMLLDWITRYETREDTFSRAAHERLFAGFAGEKTRYTGNDRRG